MSDLILDARKIGKGRHPIALVGLGEIALNQHVPVIKASDDWQLAATVSRNASIEGIPHYTNITEMLAQHPDIAVVSLCIPPAPRFAYAQEIIHARRHLMLEKPPGATITEVQILQELAQQQGVCLFATWHSRQAPQVSVAKDWLQDKKLLSLQIIWKEDVRRWHLGQDWVWQSGGFGVFDPGINALSIMTEILPDPVYLHSAELSIPENCATPIAATLEFAHPGGARVSAEFDWRQEGEQTWEIIADTDSGTMLLSDGGATIQTDGERKTVDNPLDSEYPSLYLRMAELVQQGASDVDLRPLSLVQDAFALGRRHMVAPFHW